MNVFFLQCSMNTTRYGHTASKLLNGKVLVTGGYNGTVVLNTAELYDPSTETWTVVSDMNDARNGHTSSVLENGKVLVIGEFDGKATTDTADLFDP